MRAETPALEERRGAPAHLGIRVTFRQNPEHEVLEVCKRFGLLLEGARAAFTGSDAGGMDPAGSDGARECQETLKK